MNVLKKAQLTGHRAAIFHLCSESNPRYFLSGAGDGWVVRWDLQAPDPGRLIAKVETQIFSLLKVREQNTVVAGNMNGGVHWIDLEDQAQNRNIAHHTNGVFYLLQLDEQYVLSAGGDGMLTRWSIKERKTLESLQLSNRSLRCLDYSPLRLELAIGASDGNIYLLDARDLSLRQTIRGAHDKSVFTLRYHPDHQRLFSGGRDAHLRVWDLESKTSMISEQPAHWFTVNSIAVQPGGRWLATASRDKTIKVWDAQDYRLLKVLETVRDEGHVNSVNNLLWTGYEHQLVSASDDRSLIIWTVQ